MKIKSSSKYWIECKKYQYLVTKIIANEKRGLDFIIHNISWLNHSIENFKIRITRKKI